MLLATVGTWSWCCLSSVQAAAQSQGNNTVYSSGTTPTPTGSPAFIDASTFSSSGDICSVIQGILNSTLTTYPAAGAVVDARGFVPLSGSGGPPNYQNCSVNPFAGVTVPSTILLPASTIILTASPWVLPSNTRIIGTGFYTQLVAGFQSLTGDVVDMCSSTASTACSGISIEHLSVQSAQECSTNPSNTLYGIVNYYAQSSSYVDDVSICGMGLTGLKITSNATNSGPYSNLNINTMQLANACSGNGLGVCPTCVDIEAQTRGVHGITCIGSYGVSGKASLDLTTNGDAGIYVNSSNNTIANVHIEGFFDGIEIGDTSSSVSNVVIDNVVAGSSSNGRTRNTIHICGSNFTSGGQFGSCLNYPASGNTPNGDVTIVAVTDLKNGGGINNNGSTSVQDDVTNTSIAAPKGIDGTTGVDAGIYALGELVGGSSGDAARFSTNPSYPITGSNANGATMVPTWGVGDTSVSGGCNTPGAVYSNTAVATNTIYVCTYSGTSYAWSPII